MALTFSCNTCGRKFPVEISVNRLIYTDQNKRVEIKSEDQDCENCEAEIEKKLGSAREQARADIRAKHQTNGQQ